MTESGQTPGLGSQQPTPAGQAPSAPRTTREAVPIDNFNGTSSGSNFNHPAEPSQTPKDGDMTGGSISTSPEALERLWEAMAALQGETFRTSGRNKVEGVEFTYKIRGGEMFVDRKEKSITKATVFAAYRRAAQLQGVVTGPKKLGTFGASYLYPVFIRLGVIKSKDELLREPTWSTLFND